MPASVVVIVQAPASSVHACSTQLYELSYAVTQPGTGAPVVSSTSVPVRAAGSAWAGTADAKVSSNAPRVAAAACFSAGRNVVPSG